MEPREWITVHEAAAMMGVCKRQALRLLARRNAESGGRLLRRLGDKRMPGRPPQASKYLVSVAVFRESMRPDAERDRDIEAIRFELAALRQRVAALGRAVRRSPA